MGYVSSGKKETSKNNTKKKRGKKKKNKKNRAFRPGGIKTCSRKERCERPNRGGGKTGTHGGKGKSNLIKATHLKGGGGGGGILRGRDGWLRETGEKGQNSRAKTCLSGGKKKE